jgi:polyisoprenyl-phosphate glycosyltransferase
MAKSTTAQKPRIAKSAAPPQRKLISICVPVYNEAENITRLMERLRALAEQNSTYDFEFLFTDNASEDATYDLLKAEAQKDSRIRVMRFSRNFGFQRSILTNFLNARGDAAIQIDADLQDPPEMIAEFLRHWEKGYKVVYGVRKRRPEGRLLETARKAYYRLVDRLSEVDVPPDAGDFRLIDRVIIGHMPDLKDRAPYIRGYIASLGYPQIGIPYERSARLAGTSKFKLPALIKLAIDGVCSQSTLPLHYITMLGFLVCAVAFAATLLYLTIFLISPSTIPEGFTTLALLMFFSIGLNALFIGVIGEYVGRIFDTVRGHPMTIVEKRIENAVESRTLE